MKRELEGLRARVAELEASKAQRKRTEEELRDSEAKYRQIVENAHEAIIVAQDGRLKYINPKGSELIGYSKEELTAGLFMQFIHPDDREMVMENYLKRLREGGIPGPYQFRVIHKSGNVMWTRIRPVRIDWEGRPATLNFLEDVTEQRRAEEALKESEELNRTLVENSLAGIYVRQDDRIVFVNDRLVDMLGYTYEEFKEKSFIDLVHPDDREDARKRSTQRMEGKEIAPKKQYRAIAKDGNIKWVEASGSPITYRGEPAVLGNLIEITEQKRSEEALRESEQRYRTLVEEAMDIICTVDLKTGIITSANSFAERMLGYKLEDIVNKKTFLDLLNPRDQERVIQRLYELSFEKKRSPSFPIQLRRADGSFIDVEVNGAVTYSSEGVPEAFVGVLRDVTDHRRAERALRESEGRYRTLVNNSLTGICIIQDGKFQFVNERLAEMSGYSEEELLGMSFLDLVHPGDRDFSLQLAQSRIGGKPPTMTHQYRGLTKQGEIRWIETFGVLTHYNGRPAVLVNLLDVTDRKEAEIQLRQSEEKYRRLFEESKDIVYISTPEGRFLDINPVGLEAFGYSDKSEMLGLDIATDLYMDPKERDSFQRIIEKHGFVKDYEATFKRKDGQPVDVLITATAVQDDEGNTVAYRGIMRDITEKKRLEQQLFQAQKMESMGTLAGGIAHDFNNLLTGILGYASFLKTQISRELPMFGYIETIETSAMRAAELTSQLLAFARGGKYEVKPVDLNTTVEETLKIIERTFDKSIKIEGRLHQCLPTVEADAGQILQVLMNLCVNARDAISGEGSIIIETDVGTLTDQYLRTRVGAKEGQYVILSVTDTGIGMDNDIAQRVFEPFFTTKEKGKGTGLGLAMVYGVVKNHGGFVRVYSEPGEGSTFKVYLPASGKPEPKEVDRPTTLVGGAETILVVDDEEPVRLLSKDILETHGYTVLLAENGEEAASLYEQHKNDIQLVILDMIMPRMGGRETFLKLKNLNPDIKALLSTGYSKNEKAQEILDSGVLGFIQKPYQLADLLTKVRVVLDSA